MRRAYLLICPTILIYLSSLSSQKEQDERIAAVNNFYNAFLVLKNNSIPKEMS